MRIFDKVQLKEDGAVFFITGIEGTKRDGIQNIRVDNTWYNLVMFEKMYNIIEGD